MRAMKALTVWPSARSERGEVICQPPRSLVSLWTSRTVWISIRSTAAGTISATSWLRKDVASTGISESSRASTATTSSCSPWRSIHALGLVRDRLADFQHHRMGVRHGGGQLDLDRRPVQAEGGIILDVVGDEARGGLGHAERRERPEQALDLGVVARGLDRFDEPPSAGSPPLGLDDPRLPARPIQPGDPHRRDLEARHAHEVRLAPLGGGQVDRGEQPGVDDLDAFSARRPHVAKAPLGLGLAELQLGDRPIGRRRAAGHAVARVEPDRRGRGRQSVRRRLARDGTRLGHRRSSRRLRTRASSRVGSAATSLGSTICQRPAPLLRSKTRCSSPRSIATRRIADSGVSIRSRRTRPALRSVVRIRAHPGHVEPPQAQQGAEEQDDQHESCQVGFHHSRRAT